MIQTDLESLILIQITPEELEMHLKITLLGYIGQWGIMNLKREFLKSIVRTNKSSKTLLRH